jgi:hypothetical protein
MGQGISIVTINNGGNMRKGLLTMSLLALFLAGSNLWAQSEASVTGQVTDTTGAAIPGAKVTVTNEGTSGERIVATDSAGIYDVPALVPGMYTIKVEMKGFRLAQRKGIELQVQQAARLDFQLEVGQVTQVVEVQGGAIQLNTENATVGSVVENERIVDLPLNGRDYLQLTALDANVSWGVGNENGSGANRLGGQRITEMISVAGGRTEYNYFALDGVSNTDVSFNTYTFLPSIDALQEFKIMTGIFPAEYGRGTAQINTTTKPGTNDVHGSLFEFVRNSSTDAQSYCGNLVTGICPPGNILHQNQFGGVIGGPIYIPHVINGRNKLFFMFNFEGLRRSQAANESGSVLTAAERIGDFTGDEPGTTTPWPTLYDPNTRVVNAADTAVTSVQTFASECGGANMIPNGTNCSGIPSRIDGYASKLLAFEPVPNSPGSTNLVDSFPSKQSNDQYTARIDWNESANSTWFGRSSWSNEVGVIINNPIQQLNDHISSHPWQWELSNVRTFSPTLVNDFRFGYNRLINGYLNYDAGTFNEVGLLTGGAGLPGVATPYPAIYGIPVVSIIGLNSFGDDSGEPSLIGDNTFEWADTVAKVHGKHSFRMGADIRYDQFDTAGNSFIRGAYSFNGQVTGPNGTTVGAPGADYLLGIPNLFDSALALAQTELRGWSQAYFVDDTWKVRHNLTVNVGLRYEYIEPYHEKHDNVANILWPAPNESATTGLEGSGLPTPLDQPVFIRPGNGNFYANTPANFVFGGGILVARTDTAPGMGHSLYTYWKTNFAPRLGISYSPTPNWVIRLGGGIFYTQDSHDIDFDPGRNLAARRQLPFNAISPNLTFENPLGTGGSSLDVLQPFVLAAGPNMKTTYVEQYLIDIQRQITPTTFITVGYLGNMSHDIQGLMDNNDPPTPGPGSLSNVPGSLRPYPAFGTIQTNSPWANGAYNGLSVRLKKTFSEGLSLNQVYTWSHSIDDDSAIRDHGGDTQFPQNPYNAIADRSLSIFNMQQRAVTSLLYDLPAGKGRHFLNQGGVSDWVLGGWEVGSLVSLQSGFPENTSSGSDPANIGESGYERPSYTGLPVKPAKQTINQWINLNAFTVPAAYTYGNVGRNTVIGPWFGDWDMNIQKHFTVHEKQYFELRFEAFNTTNHPNFGLPATSLANKTTFGTITGAGSMRILQLGLKYVF